MGLIKDLVNIVEDLEEVEAKFSGENDGTKIRYFKIADKQSFRVIFLQELALNSPDYSEKNGVGALSIEHSNPQNFKKKAQCTIDEGQCYGCEEHKKDYRAGWGQKRKLYISVLVDNGEDKPYVALMSQGNGPKSVTPALIEMAGEFGSISDTWYKVKRNGAGQKDTSYLLTRLSSHGKNVEDYEVYNIDEILKPIPYERQEAHYLTDSNDEVVNESEKEMASASSAESVKW